jgi:hypothetical protein
VKIAYYSTDEGNRCRVRRWAARRATRVVAGCADRPTADGPVRGVVLDLDSLPAPDRAAWVDRVLAGWVRGPVLVHATTLADAEAPLAERAKVVRGPLNESTFTRWLRRVRERAARRSRLKAAA